jgi:hypothetical protein
MSPRTRFRVKFGGKSYPDYRPAAAVILSQSKKEAEQWAIRQLEVYGLDPSQVKVEISLVEDPPKAEATQPVEKKPKKNRSKPNE